MIDLHNTFLLPKITIGKLLFIVNSCSSKSADPPEHHNHRNTRKDSYEYEYEFEEQQYNDHLYDSRIVNGDDARPEQFPYQVQKTLFFQRC